MNKGMVFLVGAGPGDPGASDPPGKRASGNSGGPGLRPAGLQEFLSWYRRAAKKIYVGKESGRHSRTQEEINGILGGVGVKGKRVIRLKGGDPFVFGRGGEEIHSLSAHGIPMRWSPA